MPRDDGIGASVRRKEDFRCVTGQGSYMDYAMPQTDNMPNFTVDTQATPCSHNPAGVKGCGEASAIAAPAAVMNAVTGAMRDAGATKPIYMPANAFKGVGGAAHVLRRTRNV